MEGGKVLKPLSKRFTRTNFFMKYPPLRFVFNRIWSYLKNMVMDIYWITQAFYKNVFGRIVRESEAKFLLQGTILTDVDPDAPVMKEEVFGPVLPVTTFSTLDEAIDHANATRFGLGSSVWTHDARTISRATEELNAGIIWVNQHLRIPPEVPFGGMKSSGIGRENGRNALLSYLEEKTILINP